MLAASSVASAFGQTDVSIVLSLFLGFWLLVVPNYFAFRRRRHRLWVLLLTVLPSFGPFVVGVSGNLIGVGIMLLNPIGWWFWVFALRLALGKGNRRSDGPRGAGFPEPGAPGDPLTPPGHHF